MSQSALWRERAILPSRMVPPFQGRAGLSLDLATEVVLLDAPSSAEACSGLPLERCFGH